MAKNKIENVEHEAHEKWKDLIQQLIKKEMIEKEIKKKQILNKKETKKKWKKYFSTNIKLAHEILHHVQQFTKYQYSV